MRSAARTAIAILLVFYCGTFGSNTGAIPACFAMPSSRQQGRQESAGTGGIARSIGTIKAINGSNITLTPDTGSEINVAVEGDTRILRVAPGEKNLKNATPIQLQELQVGDRILVGGKPLADAKSVAASSVVAIKRSDVEARQQRDREDWQKRGIGGVVQAVDSSNGSVAVSVSGFTGSKTVKIQTAKDTVIRRYASDSVKFDDAKLSTLQEIKPGDQLRARGDRPPDGSELKAEEIVSGTFRNVVGTISSIDASTGNVSVQDLLTKKTVPVKITSESQLRKLPLPIAQRIAVRLKGGPAAGEGNAVANDSRPAGSAGGDIGMGGGTRSGGSPDFQQMLGRMPAATIADLQKGDAVMIVSTEGTASDSGTVVTLLSGVEPILQAAPNASQASMLTPWSLSAPAADIANQ